MDEISGYQPDARPAEHFAGKFAAKEALMKAMDTGPLQRRPPTRATRDARYDRKAKREPL